LPPKPLGTVSSDELLDHQHVAVVIAPAAQVKKTLHHTVKRTVSGKPAAERGSSALRGAADAMMLVTKKNDILTLSCVSKRIIASTTPIEVAA